MGSEILQRQRVVRQRTERGIDVAEGEVEGSKNITRIRTALLLDKRYWNHGIDDLNGQKDFPRDFPTWLSVMAWEARRIPALRAGRIRGYSNRENNELFSLSKRQLTAFAKLSYEKRDFARKVVMLNRHFNDTLSRTQEKRNPFLFTTLEQQAKR